MFNQIISRSATKVAYERMLVGYTHTLRYLTYVVLPVWSDGRRGRVGRKEPSKHCAKYFSVVYGGGGGI